MSISGLALSRVSHQAFGGLEAAYVRLCTHVCAHVFLCDTTDSLSLFSSLRLTHTCARPEGANL